MDADHIRIGGRAPWTEIARADLPRGFDGLKAAAREMASLRSRAFGASAGDLSRSARRADGAAPLLTLDAEVELASAAGARRLSLASFFASGDRAGRRSNEIVSAIIVPRRMEGAASSFVKLGGRCSFSGFVASAAALLRMGERGLVVEARVAVGSCSPEACRLPALEAALIGLPAERGLGGVAGLQHLSPLPPVDATRDAALILVRRTLEACVWDARV